MSFRNKYRPIIDFTPGFTKPISLFHYSENIHNLWGQTTKPKMSRLLHTGRLFYSLQNSLQTTGSKEKETPLVLNNLIRNTCLAVKLLWSRLMCLMPTIRLIYDSLQIRRGSNSHRPGLVWRALMINFQNRSMAVFY